MERELPTWAAEEEKKRQKISFFGSIRDFSSKKMLRFFCPFSYYFFFFFLSFQLDADDLSVALNKNSTHLEYWITRGRAERYGQNHWVGAVDSFLFKKTNIAGEIRERETK